MEFIVQQNSVDNKNNATFFSGKNVIFLHGWGGDYNSFLWLKKYISGTLHFASLDGFGCTPPPQDVTILGYALRLRQYIEGNNLKNIVLVGHSFGGRVAIEYASRYSIDGLVLVDSAGIKPKFSLKRNIKILQYKLAKKLSKIGCYSTLKLQKFGSSDYKAANSQMQKVMLSAVNYNQKPILKKISAPTLIIWGKNDDQTPLYMAKILHKQIKDSGLVVLGGGHFSFLDNSADFVKIIDYFIKNI